MMRRPVLLAAACVLVITASGYPAVEAKPLLYDSRSAEAGRELTLRAEDGRLVIVDDRTGSVVAAAAAAGTERVVVWGASGSHDDTLTVDLSRPLSLPGGIDFDGGAHGWDTLVVTGGAVDRETVTQLTPHDGIVDLDGLVVRYTNLEPVTDTVLASMLVVNGTAGMDTVTVSDGPGPGQATISSPTFESITFSNKINVIFDGMGGGDSFTFSNPTPPAALSTFIVRNVATVRQTASINYRDLGVSATGEIDLDHPSTFNDVDNIELVTQDGAITYRDTDGVRIGGVSVNLTGLRVTNSGSIFFMTVGTIELADTDGPDVTRVGAGNVILLATGFSSDIVATVDHPAVTAPAGLISLSAHRDILLGTAGAGFDNDVRGFGNVGLTAANIVISGQTDVVAGEFGNPGIAEARAQTGGQFSVRNAASFGTAGVGQTFVTAAGGVSLTANNPSALFSRAVFVRTPRLIIAPGSGINAPSVVSIFTSLPVDLGSTTDAAAALEISDAEVDRISTPQLNVGSTSDIAVTQPITFAGSLRLHSPGELTATGPGSLNAPKLDFQDTGDTGRTWTINAASVTISPGAPIPYSGASTLRAGGFRGRDTFNVTPSATTAFEIDGSDPVPPDTPGDTLDVETAGTTAPFISSVSTPTGYRGGYTFGNRAPVTFEEIETIEDASTAVAVTKSSGSNGETPGTPVTYTIVVSNAGPLGASETTVVDTLPPALTDVTWTCSASPGSACPAAGAGNLNQTVSLAAGGTATFQVSGDIDPSATGSLTNTVTVGPPAGTDANPANDSATDTDALAAEADLAVTKSTSRTQYVPGGSIPYTITLTNAGPSNATSVELTDALPAQTTFVSLDAPAGFACTTPAAGANGTVTCTTATLAAGATVTFTLVVRVDGDAEGNIANTAAASAATADPSPANSASTSALAAAPAGIPTLTEGVLLLLAALLAAAALKRL